MIDFSVFGYQLPPASKHPSYTWDWRLEGWRLALLTLSHVEIAEAVWAIKWNTIFKPRGNFNTNV